VEQLVKEDPLYPLILHVLIILTISAVLILLDSSMSTTPLLGQSSVLALDLYDDFEDPAYTITDNQTSPNGKWLNK
jgi:hypothetical protein